MANFNSIVAASVNNFNGNLDKNGKNPVILNVIAGKFPNRNVLAGTIAENLGIEVGKSYLFSVREVESNEHGRQFIYSKLKELSAMEIVDTFKNLGQAEMFAVEEVSVNAVQGQYN